MSYRVWLTETAKTSFVTTNEKKYGEMKDVARFNGLEVYTEETSGKCYISISRDPLDPTIELPTFPKGSVRKVTFTSKHFEGFRSDGIYRYKGATARVETTQKLHTPMNMEDTTHREVFQEIQISAGSVRTLREIYTKIRSKTIEPTEDWGSPMTDRTFAEMLGLISLARAHIPGGGKPPSDMN